MEAIDKLLELENRYLYSDFININEIDTDGSFMAIRISDDITEEIMILRMPSEPDLYVRGFAIIEYIKKIRYKIEGLYGDFCFGCHDSYDRDIEGSFVFSKEIHRKGILIPDFFALTNYSRYGLDCSDIDIPYELKWNQALFAGATTGNDKNILLNDRLQFCSKAQYSDIIHGFCTAIVQMKESQISKAYADYKKWISVPICRSDQLHFKFLISIDGNTACWDRVPWILKSNSLLFKQKSNNVCWYYPYLHKDVHYKEFDMNGSDWMHRLECQVEAAFKNEKECRGIIINANVFVSNF